MAASGSVPSGFNGSSLRMCRAKISYGLAIHRSIRVTLNSRGRASTGGRGCGGLDRGKAGGMITLPRPGDPGLLGLDLAGEAGRLDQRFQPLEPARGHGRHAVHFQRAREIDGRRAERLGEVVGAEPDAPLRRGQAELLAHGPAEPGACLLRARPHAFVQAAEDDHVRLLKPRFERSPDEQARMRRPARAHHLAGEQAAIEGRIVSRASSSSVAPSPISSDSSRLSASPASPCHSPDEEPAASRASRSAVAAWASASAAVLCVTEACEQTRRSGAKACFQVAHEAEGRRVLLRPQRRAPPGSLLAGRLEAPSTCR